jgi:hypothetical protein
VEFGCGKDVEDTATALAAVIGNLLAAVAVNTDSFGGVALRTAESLWVQQPQQLGVARRLVHQVSNWKVHRIILDTETEFAQS